MLRIPQCLDNRLTDSGEVKALLANRGLLSTNNPGSTVQLEGSGKLQLQ
jgi:hypothetical protein